MTNEVTFLDWCKKYANAMATVEKLKGELQTNPTRKMLMQLETSISNLTGSLNLAKKMIFKTFIKASPEEYSEGYELINPYFKNEGNEKEV